MDLILILIAVVITSIVTFLVTKSKIKIHQIQVDNSQLEEKQRLLQIAEKELSDLNWQKKLVEQEILTNKDNIRDLIAQSQDAVDEVSNRHKQVAAESFESWIETLDTAMSEKEEELESVISNLKAEIEKEKATREAIIQANLREKELLEQSDFYKISISDCDLADIHILEEVKPRLRKPEVLSKLIWTTYYQKGTNTLCSNVLGEKTVCGIYKITDTTTGLPYIGQSVDIATRWKSHIKSGLGAAIAANNKLYSAMKETGVHHFTFELLEACPSVQLNEKERYYIELYQTSVYGLNTVKGIK